MYAYLREDDPNIDTSLRCIREGRKDLIIGYEIGIRPMDRFPSKSRRGDIKDKSHNVRCRMSIGALGPFSRSMIARLSSLDNNSPADTI